MKRKQVALLGCLAALAGLVAWLAVRNPQPPLVPPDRDHVFVSDEGCLTCHGPAGSLPKTPTHPIGNDCLRCHGSR